MESNQITGVITEPLIEEARGQYKFYSFRLGKKVINPKTKEQKIQEITFDVSSFNEKMLHIASTLKKGEFIEVKFGLGSNQSKDGRWFNKLSALQILVPKEAPQAPQATAPAPEVATPTEEKEEINVDDIPF